ncbi:J domain-containing protein [Agriterribacter sp.]|uniref:J domain-containing protein n=1 Tax=Agriterribacter sp. TaxID=2821509 RepID=UPI002CF23EF2|nr:DnaJ domain-containing protein [Agriterribacter sp.]HTN08158.1 DnaJ domain-containing protein [Agriterribacter sp.]
MTFKNHYRTLGVSPHTSSDAIKKEFRKLALQYHPDMNAGNEFATLRFRELQEAYETLSHPSKRAKYHYEWKLHFPHTDVNTDWEHTPLTILNEGIQLNRQIAAMDIFRMNKEAIFIRVKKILSEPNINLLLQHKDAMLNQKLIIQLLSASSELPFKYVDSIAASLKMLAGTDDAAIKMITDFVKTAQQKNYWEKFYPLIVLLITLAICVLIYGASR